MSRPLPELVLAVHPTPRGFGWALYEGDQALVDWGVASSKDNRSERCMKRFKKLLDQYRPSTFVMENFEQGDPRRGDRIRTLAKTMHGFADSRDMGIFTYRRTEVCTCLTNNAKASRYTVACAVAERIPLLRRELSRKRRYWEEKDGKQCLFDAAALGLTHYALTKKAD
jgi:hypothetical protein